MGARCGFYKTRSCLNCFLLIPNNYTRKHNIYHTIKSHSIQKLKIFRNKINFLINPQK